MFKKIKKIFTLLVAGGLALSTVVPLASSTIAYADTSSKDRYIDVTECGANGKDKKDDRKEIQTALNEARRTDGTLTVYVPAGTYYLERHINIFSDTNLVLADGATIVSMNGEDMVWAAFPDKGDGAGYTREKNITVSGGTWDGNASAKKSSNILFFCHCENVTIKDTTIKNCDTYHHIDFSGVKNGTVKNCTFQNFSGNVSSYVAEAVHTDYCSKETAECASPYDNTPCQNIVVEGCTFKNCYGGVGNHHDGGITSSGITIKNNTFTNMGGACVQLPRFKNATISGNAATNVGTFAYIHSGSSDINITDNTVKNATQNGIYVTGNSSATIKNNTIENSGKDGIKVDSGIVELISNVSTGSSDTDIYIASSVSGTIDSNTANKTSVKSSNISSSTVKKDSDGVWYYYDANGKKNLSYTGFASNSNGKWYIENGRVTFKAQDIIKDTTGALGDKGAWYYVIGSKVQTSFTGLSNFSNNNGWWYIKNGKVDFSHNGVDKNKNGWWYVTGGKVQFGFTGLANYKNKYGWWYIKDGKVDFTHNGIDENKNGWWYVVNGKVDFSANTVAKNQNGWWYITGGKVRFGYTGVANYRNKYGWWFIRNGKVDFTYTGRASNKYGTWNVVNGKVRF